MGQILISKEYFDLLKKLNSIAKIKSAVIFKGKTADGQYDGKYYFNIPSKTNLVHVVASENDVKFDGDQLQISSLPEFLKYAEAAGYPKCVIEVAHEVTMRGREYDNIVIHGKTDDARMSVADISCFVDKNHFKVCMTRAADPMRYLAKIAFTTDTIDRLVKNIKLVPSCTVLALNIVDDECKFLLRGKGNQQITHTLDSMSFKVENDSYVSDAYANPSNMRLFPTNLFRLMGGLGVDIELEIRHLKTPMNDIMALKGYCVKQGALLDEENKDAGRSEIYIAMMSSESASDKITNIDFVL